MRERLSDTPAPSPLIFASKVSGTPVFNRSRERIGHIEDVALEKATGQVAYVVLAFGGFLGAGNRLYPIPWHILTFDPAVGGYVAALDKEQLQDAPFYQAAELADVGDAEERHRKAASHWGPFI